MGPIKPRRFSEIYEGSVKDRECAGNLSFYAPEGSFSIGCGVEMKGHTSLFAPKKSLGVSFRGCYGAETLACDIFGEGPAEFSELSIRAGQDYSSTVFRNELMQELCAELDTTVTQRSRYCVLYINGEYWGIYCLKDDITGILPIKKYNTESGLNNFCEYSMIDPAFLAPCFGFTKEEVKMLCKKHGMDMNEMESWYDGYRIGKASRMFNPYSVMRAINDEEFGSYWTTTGLG